VYQNGSKKYQWCAIDVDISLVNMNMWPCLLWHEISEVSFLYLIWNLICNRCDHFCIRKSLGIDIFARVLHLDVPCVLRIVLECYFIIIWLSFEHFTVNAREIYISFHVTVCFIKLSSVISLFKVPYTWLVL
jgi:hypothetical protein